MLHNINGFLSFSSKRFACTYSLEETTAEKIRAFYKLSFF